jgi:hypothetical protein
LNYMMIHRKTSGELLDHYCFKYIFLIYSSASFCDATATKS